MKKPSRRDHARATARENSRDCRGQEGSIGRWAFSLTRESLSPLGTTEGVRRVAYRTVDGHLRFLPL